ncbi:MAG: hypothetical protein ATN33_01255 [Epulopiscium sp. Nele67-Bin001]|nr:MAG: hypothetical protein BEN18_08140 [Epulopiscium sp. Nuni2H_MBin001]OON91393.1 MAG: hypothetical protein ATN33_01255 [Epulopiscium sp. Nele67-Bin001]
MKYYTHIKDLKLRTIQDVFKMAFNYCNRVIIYFPNECDEDIAKLKQSFTSLIVAGNNHENDYSATGWLKEKQGFTMLIATLSRDIQTFIVNINPILNISLGLLDDGHVFLYLGDDGQLIIETDKITPDIHPVLSHLQTEK